MVQIQTMEDDFLLVPIIADQLLIARIFLLTLEMAMLLMPPVVYGLLVKKVVALILPMVLFMYKDISNWGKAMVL